MESANIDELSNNIRERQHQFGRIMVEINRRITAGENHKIILNFLFDSLDTIIPYDRIGIALIEDHQLCAKWMKSKLPCFSRVWS